MSDDLLLHQVGEVGVVTFNRPSTSNAFTLEMYEDLAALCERIAKGELPVRSLVLTGAGEQAFAAGTNIAQFSTLSNAEDALAYERLMDRVMGAVESLPIPCVAAIKGACTGGGAIIAACCDIRIANESMKFGVPVARTLGNCLSSDNLLRLIDLLGVARTREILMTSRLIGIDEALAINLVNEVDEDPLARAIELCERMQKNAPLTIAATKEALVRIRRVSQTVESDDLIVKCYTSDDFKEGMDAFLSKRKPNWLGR